jgi:hypothetical protein
MQILIGANVHIDDDAKQALGAMELPHYFKVKNDQQLGRFYATFTKDEIEGFTRMLRRMYFVILVDNVYKMPREAVGGVNGVGGAVPEAPNFEMLYSEDDWKTYVDSIQDVYKESKSTLLDTVTQAASDAIFGSVGSFVDDMQDWAAFGSNKNGKILFSDGGSTKVLGSEIKDAKVAVLDDPSTVPSISQAISKKIRELMKA